jgi:dihydrofolate reductase
MTKIVLSMSVSLDGIAGPDIPDEDGMALFESVLGWVFPLRSWREQQGMEGGEDSVDSRIWAENFDRFGPQVIGRRMFDSGYPHWGENPPFHAPVFVVTSRGQEPITKQGGTSYTFVTGGIEAAVAQARTVAGGKDVLLAGGVSIAQQGLAAGLVDEVVLHVVPVLAGRGMRLFGSARADLTPVETTQGEGALHVRYSVKLRGRGRPGGTTKGVYWRKSHLRERGPIWTIVSRISSAWVTGNTW